MDLRDEIADPILYRTYYSIMMNSILEKLRYKPTINNKAILHRFHKRVLGYGSIAGVSHDRLSKFLLDVCVFWAERGIFVKTSGKQLKFKNIERLPLSLIWRYL